MYVYSSRHDDCLLEKHSSLSFLLFVSMKVIVTAVITVLFVVLQISIRVGMKVKNGGYEEVGFS